MITQENAWQHIGQIPHCDNYILHAPGECEYCDRHPEWQALRFIWGIAFTGHSDDVKKERDHRRDGPVLPCPADLIRPPGSSADHRRWGGNTATTRRGDPSQPRQTLASIMMYGDQGGRAQWPLPERLQRYVIGKPFEKYRMWRNGYVKSDDGLFWVKRPRRS